MRKGLERQMHGCQLCADHKLHLPVIQCLEHNETCHASSSRHGSSLALLECRSTSPSIALYCAADEEIKHFQVSQLSIFKNISKLCNPHQEIGWLL
jgi:hypothetical protein